VAPTYDLARRTWDYLNLWINPINRELGKVLQINKSNFTITSKLGSKLELKSTDNPASLLGAGLDLLIIDEAARVNEDVWRTHLRPTLTDRNGRAIFISTPYGKNWFYDMHIKGLDNDPKWKDYSYHHMCTSQNITIPNIDQEMVSAKQELSINEFSQEYEAEFIEGAGSVFRNLKDVIVPTDFRTFPHFHEDPNPDLSYQGGLDLARLDDFSVLTIVNRSNPEYFTISAIDRFNQLDYAVQKPRISLLSEQFFKPPIHAEQNNIGDAIIHDLTPNFKPFKTTNQSKKEIINNLAILIEQKKIRIPAIPKLIQELETFSYNITPSGTVRYSAPNGLHDDMVMSLALALYTLKDPLPSIPKHQTYITPTNFTYDEY